MTEDMSESSDTEVNLEDTETVDNTVTWQRIKELVVTMKDSINYNTNQAIGEVKSEVSHIKVQMEKYNGTIEEVQGRVSQVEDKVEKMEDLRSEVETLKKYHADHIKEMNKEVCRARRNNIIINGVPGTSKNKQDAKKAFEDFIIDGLELGTEWLKKVEIEELYRFPAKKTEETSLATIR